MQPHELRAGLSTTSFAFRGYNVTNLGKSRDLLNHPAYGPFVRRRLVEANAVAGDLLHSRVDLVHRIEAGKETSLKSYGEAVALIVAMEAAQLDILRDLFDIPFERAQSAFGYSLGEVSAVSCAGVFSLADSLRVPLAVVQDCIELASDVAMGIVFTRGKALDMDAVRRLCLETTAAGKGVIDISSYLSPNTVLLLGQGETLDAIAPRLGKINGEKIHLRRNPHVWPPLHTSIMWQRSIPCRVGVLMQSIGGGFHAPRPTVLSLVTGKASYNDHNSRDILRDWVDHPQRLWDVMLQTLIDGTETIVHVGPEPNLIPATYKRLSDNVQAQLQGSLAGFGLRAVSGIVRHRTWLQKLLASRTALLRAPFLRHIVLEGWLLEQRPV